MAQRVSRLMFRKPKEDEGKLRERWNVRDPGRELKVRARRAYELGRVRAKLFWALGMASPALVGLGYSGEPALTAVQAVLAGGASLGLLWRGQDYGRGALAGAVIGMPAFAVPLYCCASGTCAAEASSGLVTLCFAGGAAAGLVLTAGAFRRKCSVAYVLSAATVAGLTAGIGCSVIGLGGVLGLMAGLGLGVGPALILARRV